MPTFLTAVLTLVLLFFPPKVFAQNPPGISVSPAMLKLDLATDQPNFTLNYQNSTSSVLQLTFSAKDFTGLEEGWRVKLLDQQDAQNYHYSLSSWLDFSPETMLLKSGETGNLTVNIRQANLSPGGHYASIVADISPPFPEPGTVVIKSQLVSLAFIRANTGQENDAAKISGFTAVKDNFLTLPQKFSLRFDNSGNTQLTPHGVLTVKNFLGYTVSQSILNEDSLITLPESIRKYEIKTNLDQIAWLLPGPYQTDLTVNFGRDKTIYASTKFFVLGSKNSLTLVTILLFLLLIALKYRKTRK